MEAQTHNLIVRETEVGRVDRILADRLGLSRTRVQKLLLEGLVSVNGEPARKSLILAIGDELEVLVHNITISYTHLTLTTILLV